MLLLCSVLRFSLAFILASFWVFVALKWVWIPHRLSQIIVSEMGMSLLNFFFVNSSLTNNFCWNIFLSNICYALSQPHE